MQQLGKLAKALSLSYTLARSLSLFHSCWGACALLIRRKKFWKKFVACLKFQSEANRTRLHSMLVNAKGVVILYRGTASTAAFPTNLLEINRAFSRRESSGPKIYDSILGIGRSKMPPFVRSFVSIRFVSFAFVFGKCNRSASRSASTFVFGFLLLAWPGLPCSWPGQNSWKLQVTVDAMKSTLLLLRLRLRVAWDALFFLEFV